MSNPPQVSVVIPAYNRQATIGRAVNSVLAQTMPDLELVVVDDGSSDATCREVMGISDPRLRLISCPENRGAAAARNTGISQAGAPYVAFLDSDDQWLPGKLAAQLPALENAGPHTAVSCTAYHLHLLDRNQEVEVHPEAADDWSARLLVGCDLGPGSTLLARREVFEKVGPLDQNLPRLEDWDWLLRYADMGGILLVDQPLSIVYKDQARLGGQVELSIRLFLAKHRQRYGRAPAALRRQALGNLWRQAAATYAIEGRRAGMLRCAARAFAQQPLDSLRKASAFALSRLRDGW